jgi:hypothetical protein
VTTTAAARVRMKPGRVPGQHWNGNMELVYQAIVKGDRLIGEIEVTTGLDPLTIINHVARLCDVNRVRRIGGRPQRYEPVRRGCLLSEVWR